MVSKGAGEDGFLDTEVEPSAEVINLHSGGCAFIDDIGWSHELGVNTSSDELQTKVENLRQQLLKNSDVKKVRNAMKACDISENEQLIELVKRYNFDSPGIYFAPDNYNSWTKLANEKGAIDDARYLVHEIEEVKQLRIIQQQTSFDFMGTKRNNMTRRQKQQWEADFKNYFKQAHSKALEAEYEFIAKQVYIATNGKISISRTIAAAIDPNRNEGRLYILVDGVPLEEHSNFESWQLQGKETAKLNRNQRLRLKIVQNPTVAELIRAVKQIKLNSL